MYLKKLLIFDWIRRREQRKRLRVDNFINSQKKI